MKIIKHLILTICLFTSVLLQAQDVSKIVQQYKAAIANIETVHCQVEQLDTFVTGHVWNYIGELSMMRNQKDTLFGFQFRASKTVGDEALYDGLSEFQINHKKQTYEVNTDPKFYITGSPGGQLVVSEIMNYQDPETTPEFVENDQFFVLRYAYPDLEAYDVRQREKYVFLDKNTFLPVKVIERQVSLGKKQVMTRKISNIQINRMEDQERFQKDFLNTYKMKVEESRENVHADLLKTEVKAFQLKTFAGKEVSTRPTSAKVLLLDFWEVWCGPCVQSMPKVQALADKYGAEGLEVVGVLMDPNSQESAEKMINKKGVTFPQALGNPEIRPYFRVFAIPQYVLIDQNGIIQQVFRGYDKDMEKQIKRLLVKAK